MYSKLLMVFCLIFVTAICYGQDYVGSDACMTCHGAADVTGAGYNIHAEVFKTGHPYKLNAIDGAAPTYPADTSPGVPNPPEGHAWSDFSMVIGGYGWKARFVDTTGHIFTGDELSTTTGDSVAQYNLETGGWVTYHKGETKTYDFTCFVCHTTGPSPDSTYNLATPGLGTFAEPGITCEGCHGPGGDHAGGTNPLPVTGDSLAINRCGDCHQRGGITNAIPASGNYIRHHEQLNEMRASKHGDGESSELTCADCHNTHIALHWPDAAGEGLSGLVAECEDCHGNKAAMVNGEEHSGAADCVDCHMAKASKSAVGTQLGNGWQGDVKTHIWAINTDAVTREEMFTEDGGLVELDGDGLAAVTLDFVCLPCHQGEDVAWASGHAQGIHQGQERYLGLGYDASPGPADGCVDCHGATITSWQGTGHSTAQADGSVSAGFGYSCLQCHNTGWDTLMTNWGADEYVMEEADNGFTITDSANWNRVENIQCEACHGAVGTADSTIDMAHTGRDTDLSADLCGACHTGSHHPTFDEWSESKHAMSKETTIPGGAFGFIKFSSECSGCHTAEGFLQYIEQPLFSAPDVIAPGVAGNDLTCVACHDPHAHDNPGQLRDAPTQICDRCHNPEYSPDAPDPQGQALHHTTAFMFNGEGGFEYAGYAYPNSAHQAVATERCINCHVNMTGLGEFGDATGHTFEPRVEACADAGCHGENYFTLVDTSDQENKFNLYRTQTLIDSLSDVLDAKLAAATSEDSLTDAWLQAKFNWEFVHGGGSHGIHNTNYAEALLESSIAEFTPTAIEPIDNGTGLPLTYSLDQNYPNPFNPSTEIEFSIKKPGRVVIEVYDIVGRLVETLVNEDMQAGTFKTRFNAGNYATGVYIYRMVSAEFSAIKKMVLIK